MSDNRDFNLDIDDILAEFSSFSSHLGEESAPVYEEPKAPAPEVFTSPAYEEPAAEPVIEEPVIELPAEEPVYEAPVTEPVPEAPVSEPENLIEEAPPVRRAVHTPPRKASVSGVNRNRSIDPALLGYRKDSKTPGRSEAPAPQAAEPAAKPERVKPRRAAAPAEVPAPKKEKKAPKSPPANKDVQPKNVKGIVGSVFRGFIGTIFAVISGFVLLWMVLNIHPDSGAVTNSTTGSGLDLVGKLDVFMNNSASDALGELTYIKKIYTIDEGALVAPKPNPACYGTTTNPADIDAVIEKAADLIGDQELTWDPNVEFFPGSEINYYLDDTILVIAWKEVKETKVCTCSEVIIAHGSQLRRKLAGDAYGSSVQVYATKMATEANSVVAINGDFYAFRNLGITGYQRKVYRVQPETVDSCFFTADGDMLFAYAGELTGEGEAQKFMDDNNCTFCVAFGPVLVDNGELRKIQSYPIGEINTTYSRAAIGMLGQRHYLLMTINYEDGYNKTSTVHQLGEFMYEKGCQKAYTLDGGQTSVMVMKGETLNKVDWNEERIMSDIIYFATAVPEEEVS